MRRKLIEKTAILVVSITVISGCGVSYKDYSDTNVTQEDIEKPDEIETRCEYVIEDEVAKLPSDVVIIDDYSKEGTIFTSPHLQTVPQYNRVSCLCPPLSSLVSSLSEDKFHASGPVLL